MTTDESIAALVAIADELGVTPKTASQYADGAGSYRAHQPHDIPRQRKLPPRGSVEGEELAARIRREVGTDRVRTIAVAIERQQAQKVE